MLFRSPSSTVARQLLYAELATTRTQKVRKVGGRERSSYLNVLALDLKYLTSGDQPLPRGVESLDRLFELSFQMGPPHAKKVLKELKPNTALGSSLRLVNERPKPFTCPHVECSAKFAERKEVNRHIKRAHSGPDLGHGNAGTQDGGEQDTRLLCPVSGCNRRFKTGGWLARHQKSCHGLAVPNLPNALNYSIPPNAPNGDSVEQRAAQAGPRHQRTAARRGGDVVESNPVTSPGDGGGGQLGSCPGTRLRGRGGKS